MSKKGNLFAVFAEDDEEGQVGTQQPKKQQEKKAQETKPQTAKDAPRKPKGVDA